MFWEDSVLIFLSSFINVLTLQSSKKRDWRSHRALLGYVEWEDQGQKICGSKHLNGNTASKIIKFTINSPHIPYSDP